MCVCVCMCVCLSVCLSVCVCAFQVRHENVISRKTRKSHDLPHGCFEKQIQSVDCVKIFLYASEIVIVIYYFKEF